MGNNPLPPRTFAPTVNVALTVLVAFSRSSNMPSELSMRAILAVLSVAALLAAMTPAQADKRIFIIANNPDGYGVDRCLPNRANSGPPAPPPSSPPHQCTPPAGGRLGPTSYIGYGLRFAQGAAGFAPLRATIRTGDG